MKRTWLVLAVALMAVFAAGAMAQTSVIQMGPAQQWQNNAKLPSAILDTFAIYNGAATLRKTAIGTHFMGVSDDTIRVVATQSAAPRRVRIMTDTATVAFGPGVFRMDSCAYGLPSGATPNGLAIGDIDGNGRTDIVTATSVAPFRLFWLEWDGVSAFVARDSFTVNAAVMDVTIGDANNDGTSNEILFNIGQTAPSSAIMRAVWTSPGVIDTTRILLSGTQAALGVAIGNIRADLSGNEVIVVGGTTMWMVHFNGATWDTATIVTGMTSANDVAIGDIDPTLAGNEIAVVHASTSYQMSVTNWTGTAWAARAWALSATWGTSANDIAIGDVFSDNPGSEVLLMPGGSYTPRAFWISPVGGAWTRTLPVAATSMYGVAVGNVNKFRSLNSEFVLTGLGGRILEVQQRDNAVDLGTQYYRMANGALAWQGQTDTIAVQIFNAGSGAASNFFVNYKFKTSALTDSVAVAGPFNGGDTTTVKIGISAYNFTGFDTLYVYPSIAGDANPVNDTTKLHIEPIPSGSNSVAWSGFNTSAFAPTNATFNPVNPQANEWKASILTGTYNWARVTTGTNPTIAAPLEGAGMTRYPSYSATAGQSARLRTNQLTVPGATPLVKIKFYMYHDTGMNTYPDSIYVQYSTNDTAWSTVTGFARLAGANGWVAHEVEIGQFPADTKLYLGLQALSKYGNNMFVDSVRAYTVTPPLAHDAGVQSVTLPSSASPGVAFPVSVTIKNFGTDSLASIPVYYTLGAADTVRETWSGSNIGLNQTAVYAFTQQLTLPDSGNFTVYAATELIGDLDPANDKTSRTMRAWGIYALPYLQGFNATNWLPVDCDTLRYSGTAGIWSRETAGTFPTCAPYEGAAMAKFNSFNASAGNQLMFISPRIQTPGANNVWLTFAFYGDNGYATNYDSMIVDVTNDDGATWTRNVAGWWRYTAANGWRTVTVNLGSFGTDTVRVALRAKSAYGNNMFVDQVRIYDVPPQITFTSPADAATGVLVNLPVVIGFSEPIDPASFQFTFSDAGVLWADTTWNAGGDTVTLVQGGINASITYTFTVTAANDLTGNPLAAGAVPNPFTFTTNADGTPPTASVVSPAFGATDVGLTPTVVIAFSEPMNTGSIMGYSTPTDPWSIGFNAAGDTMTLTTATPLNYSALYHVIGTAGTDLAGYNLVGLPDTLAQFTTVANQGAGIAFVQQPTSTYDTLGPYQVRAVLIDPLKKTKVGVAADSLYYQIGNNAWTGVGHTAVSGDTFDYAIPGAIAKGTQVSYQLLAFDDGNIMTYSDVNTFTVLNPLAPGGLAAQGLTVPFRAGLSWNAPAEVIDYTDGIYNWTWYGDPGDPQAVRFTPQYTPAKLTSAKFLFYNTPGNVEVHVWSDSSGIPGHDLMTPVTVPISQFSPNWTTVDLSAADITVNGDYHIGYVYLAGAAPRILADAEEFTGRSQFRYLASTGPDTAWTANSYYGVGDWFITSGVSYGPGAKAYASKTPARRNVTTNGSNKHAELVKGVAQVDAPKNIDTYTVERDSATTGWVDWLTGLGVRSCDDSTLVEYTHYDYRVKVLYGGPDTSAYTGTVGVYADFTGPDGIHTSPADDDTVGTYVTFLDLIDSSGIQKDSIIYWQPPTAGSPTIATHDSVTSGNRYWYHIVTATRDSVFYQFVAYDNSLWHNRGNSPVMSFRTNLGVSGKPVNAPVPFSLANVYPNPVSSGSAVQFKFGMPQAASAKLVIYNVMGQRIATLVDGNLPAGTHAVKWNGNDQAGRKVASGIYIYKLQAGSNTATKKMIVIK